MALQALPIDDFLPQMIESLKINNSLVLSAEPGAGKTTRLPAALLKSQMSGSTAQAQKILVLEPRRIAAVSAAARIAEENSWELGQQEVGYQVRFDSQCRPETRLVFLTEALLAKRIQEDPDLSDVSIVILDEFHERSQHVDLALGFLKELQSLSRPDLKIIVMSATLNQTPLCQYLETQNTISVPGKTFPLEISYLNAAQRLQTDSLFIENVAEQIRHQASLLPRGEHLLVFLPGVGEIDRLLRYLDERGFSGKYLLQALHGSLSLGEQRKVLSPSEQSKIILATNVAESSLTIDQVTRVIDTGLQRRSGINPRTGLPTLQVTRISQSSATQRSGRAARQKPGHCLRMWSKLDQQALPLVDIPEIHRTDLTDSLLIMAELGITDPQKFSWFDPPKSEKIISAQQSLRLFQAINKEGRLTQTGKNILRWPLGTRLSYLIEVGRALNEKDEKDFRALNLAIELATLLSDPRSLRIDQGLHLNIECDLLAFRQLIQRQSNLAKVYRQLKEMSSRLKDRDEKKDTAMKHFDHLTSVRSLSDEDLIRKILFLSHPDRLCRLRNPSADPQQKNLRGLMIGGRGVTVDEKSSLKKSEYFVALDLMDVSGNTSSNSGDTKVSLASAVDESWLTEIGEIKTFESIQFDENKKTFTKTSGRKLEISEGLQLPVGSEHTQLAPAELIQEKIPEIAKKEWNYFLKNNEALSDWLFRFQFFQKQIQAHSLQKILLGDEEPLFSQEMIEAALENAAYGERSLAAIAEKDLIYFVESQLSQRMKEVFHSFCPHFFKAPTGSQIRINYQKEKPEVEIRLQELFGQSSPPHLFEGRIPLTLVLLAPNYRPVQVTQDLVSFWKNGYPEVKKELKARYPKHSWPENPLEAPPIAKGRPRKD